MVELARQPEGIPLQSREIAARQSIPQAYLDQLLVSLRRAGLVKSVRGAGGGYLLARPAATLSVADVLRPLSSELFSDRWRTDASGEPTVTTVLYTALAAARAVLTDVKVQDLVRAEDAQRATQAFMMHI
jgi:Rrf2 family protein